ncbi:hypothetical protein GCM10009821_14160 [Aeromicrobium halocynthiae]|uniref:Glycosyltransferase family 2 protein n=1 Tax=Aeromicrobium halocynthiae TaxID=560557 RepID=A0ABN2VXI5_9ACTN
MSEPTIVMTLMVRDEADVVAAMIEHHLAEGVDLVIATDNGSVDGTREILADYAQTGRLELHDYLQHDKRQSQVVSSMASRAATEHGATWVINADADEFFVAVDPSMTLRDALRATPTGIGSFAVPVTNLTGAPARRGAAFERLVWRDLRKESTLMETVALHAHPTSDVIHVGRPGVTVQQGNHGVDIPSMGRPDPAHAIEVLHLPWRTYEQYSRKIDHMGRAYEASTTLNPSPRHHGMRDYRFLRAGHLEALYMVRHPGDEPGEDFEHEPRVLHSLQRVLESGQAVRPDRLRPLLIGGWDGYVPEECAEAARVAAVVIPLELEHLKASTRWRDLYRTEAAGRRRAEEQLELAARDDRSTARRLASRVLGAVRRRVAALRRR